MTNEGQEELQADIKLIAAAPDLLEAAQFAAQVLFYNDKSSMDQAMYMLYEAIQKAEEGENK